jgi:hypothetical protein
MRQYLTLNLLSRRLFRQKTNFRDYQACRWQQINKNQIHRFIYSVIVSTAVIATQAFVSNQVSLNQVLRHSVKITIKKR